jgi:hypothetical protein
MALSKLAGAVGLLILPSNQTALLIYLLVALYAIRYIIDRPLKSTSKIADAVFLVLGTYVSGISLIGAPPVIPVELRHVTISEFRNTMFVVWWVLVSIKLVALDSAGNNLQITAALMLLPFAGVSHALGIRFHQHVMERGSEHFSRLISGVLLAMSAAGLTQLLFDPLHRLKVALQYIRTPTVSALRDGLWRESLERCQKDDSGIAINDVTGANILSAWASAAGSMRVKKNSAVCSFACKNSLSPSPSSSCRWATKLILAHIKAMKA